MRLWQALFLAALVGAVFVATAVLLPKLQPLRIQGEQFCVWIVDEPGGGL